MMLLDLFLAIVSSLVSLNFVKAREEYVAEDFCNYTYPGEFKVESLDCFVQYFPPSLNTIKFGDIHSSVYLLSDPDPRKNLNATMSTKGLSIVDSNLNETDKIPVPIIILFKERISVLTETLKSYYQYIRSPFEIIIFDDNTTFPNSILFLHKLELAGVTVHHNAKKWDSFEGPEGVTLFAIFSDFVSDYMLSSKSPYYIISDPDCALDSAPGNIIHVYGAFIEGLNINGVGASLRWDDWPDNTPFPFEKSFMVSPSNQFEFNKRNYFYIKAPTDTTFTMYRRSVRLPRLISVHRMLAPLAVRHLDWYLNRDLLPDDYIHYLSNHKSRQVNHRIELQEHIKANKTTRNRNHCQHFSKIYGALSTNAPGLLPKHLFRFFKY